MKKLITTLLLIACAFVTAYAQFAPYYGEVFVEKTGELANKLWVSADGKMRLEFLDDEEAGKIYLYHNDTRMAYLLDTAKKTAMKIDITNLPGAFGLSTENSSMITEHLGQEVIEGRLCDHYRHTSSHTFMGKTETAISYTWSYEPLKAVIRQTAGAFNDEYHIMRNIVEGPQPTHLFEIPSDYTQTEMPKLDMGNLMEMMEMFSK